MFAASTAFAQTTTVTAAWDRNTDAATSGYLVYYGTTSGGYQWSYDAGNQVAAQLTLSRGSFYYVTVRAYNASAALGLPSNEATIDLRTAVPPAPTAQISAAMHNATTALVSWQTANAVSATINGATVPLGGSQTVTLAATTTFTIVATSASGATATQSATASVTQAPPTAPTARLTATLQGSNTALLTWSTTNAVTATINGAAVSVNGSASVPVAATTTYRLLATAASGLMIDAYATVSVPTPSPSPTAPVAPTSMEAAVSGSRVTLSWRAATSGPASDRYLLSVGNSPGGSGIANGFVVGNVLTVASNLPKGRYYARVRAGNSAGVSGFSNEVSFKVGKNLVSPRGFAVQWIGATAVLSWTPSATAASTEDQPTAYVLEAGSAPSLSDVGTMTVGNVTSFRAEIPRGTFYVRVRAVNDLGDSEPTDDVMLSAPGAPGAPTNLVASGSGSTVNLRWQAPAGTAATAYVLEAGTAPGLANLGAAQIGNVTQFSTQAPPGTYYVRVRALNGSGVGMPSNEVVVRK